MAELVAKSSLETVKRLDDGARISGIVKGGTSRVLKIDLTVGTAVAMAATQALRLQLPFYSIVLTENASSGHCQIQILLTEKSEEVSAAALLLEKSPAFKLLKTSSTVVLAAGVLAFVANFCLLLA